MQTTAAHQVITSILGRIAADIRSKTSWPHCVRTLQVLARTRTNRAGGGQIRSPEELFANSNAKRTTHIYTEFTFGYYGWGGGTKHTHAHTKHTHEKTRSHRSQQQSATKWDGDSDGGSSDG